LLKSFTWNLTFQKDSSYLLYYILLQISSASDIIFILYCCRNHLFVIKTTSFLYMLNYKLQQKCILDLLDVVLKSSFSRADKRNLLPIEQLDYTIDVNFSYRIILLYKLHVSQIILQIFMTISHKLFIGVWMIFLSST
jgi:hypothetical protein